MIPNKHFGETLKKYIDINSITASKIADKLGMTPTGFFAYYKAKNPRPETIEKILKALDISLEELFREKKAVNEDEDYKTKYQQALTRENELLREIAELRKDKIKTLEAERVEGGNPVTN